MKRSEKKDRVWLKVAIDISELSTCARRQVGAVFLDVHGNVQSTGYNGVAPESPHCIDSPCPGANLPSGTGLDKCLAIHAEQNALMQCKSPKEIHTVYCTDSPCMHCLKMLSSTSARRIVFSRLYPHPEGKLYWEGLGRVWCHLPLHEPTLQDVKPCTTFSALLRAIVVEFRKCLFNMFRRL